MRKYENGEETKRLILDTSLMLFLRDGYAKVKIGDICKEAHIDRGTLYYHYSEKDSLRYAVLTDLVDRCVAYAKTKCDDPRLFGLLGAYCFSEWCMSSKEATRFYCDSFKDNPLYIDGTASAEFYDHCNQVMYHMFFQKENIDPMAYGSIYGFLAGMAQIISLDPARYNTAELFRHSMISGIKAWKHSDGQAEALWYGLQQEIERLPDNFLDDILSEDS